MGFFDRRVRESAPSQPAQRVPQAPHQAPSRPTFPLQARQAVSVPQGWPPEPPEAPAVPGMDFEEEITPETHPWAFQIGPDGRPQRSVWTWRGNRNGGAKTSATCPRCQSPNYLRPEPGAQNNYADGQGVGAYGVMVNRERMLVNPRCTDCGYPNLQAGSETTLTGRIAGMAPSAEGNTPTGLGDPLARAIGSFDRRQGRYVPISQ